jgi:hypothetical protein
MYDQPEKILKDKIRLVHRAREDKYALLQKYLYRKVFKSVKLATRLNKSRGGIIVNICNFVRSVPYKSDLTKVK